MRIGRVLGNSCTECNSPSWNTEKYCEKCGHPLDNAGFEYDDVDE